MHRILHQLQPDHHDGVSDPTTHVNSSHHAHTFFLSSSPPEPATLLSTNKAFLTSLALQPNVQPIFRNHIQRLSGISERLQAPVTILQNELSEIRAVNNNKRKERASDKRNTLKEKPVLSLEEVLQAVKDTDEVTASKKPKERMRKKRRKLSSKKRQERSNSSILMMWRPLMLKSWNTLRCRCSFDFPVD
jgi:hypothetical protein